MNVESDTDADVREVVFGMIYELQDIVEHARDLEERRERMRVLLAELEHVCILEG